MKRVKTSKGMRSPSFVKKLSIQNVIRTDKTCAVKKAPQQYRSNSLGGLSLLVGEHENARFGTSHYCLQNEFIHEGILQKATMGFQIAYASLSLSLSLSLFVALFNGPIVWIKHKNKYYIMQLCNVRTCLIFLNNHFSLKTPLN